MSIDINLAAVIERAGADLELQDPDVYEVLSISDGDREWRLQTVSSPVVHGDMLVGATRGMTDIRLLVRVYGSTGTELWARIDAITAAVSKWTYTVWLTTGGKTQAYSCWPGNVAFPSNWNAAAMATGYQDVLVTIPRQPYLL